MSKQISWRLVIAIKPDQLDDLQVLTAEMVQLARTEIGTLIYERFITDDRRFIHGYERYADPAAAITHLEQFSDRFEDRLASLVTHTELTVYGNPSPALKRQLDSAGATYLASFGDMAYWP